VEFNLFNTEPPKSLVKWFNEEAPGSHPVKEAGDI